MAMTAASLAARWKTTLQSVFGNENPYNDALMRAIAQDIINEITQNMVVVSAVQVSTSTGIGTGNAGGGQGSIT